MFDVMDLLAAVEFETSQQAQLVGLEAERRGVFFRIISEVLAIAPPYICTPSDIDEIMDVMTLSIQSMMESAG